MGKSFTRKLVAAVLTLTLVLGSAAIGFAATSSPAEGSNTPQPAPQASVTVHSEGTDGNYAQKSFKIDYTGTHAVKYQIAYRVRGGKWHYVTTTNKSYTIKKLKNKGLYEIKVVGINKDGKIGAYSKVSYRYMAKVNFKAKAKKKGRVKITAKRVKGLTGYQIKYSTSRDMKNAKSVYVKTKKNLNKTLRLSRKKTYYIQVRPLLKKGGTTYVGIIEATRAVKTR